MADEVQILKETATRRKRKDTSKHVPPESHAASSSSSSSTKRVKKEASKNKEESKTVVAGTTKHKIAVIHIELCDVSFMMSKDKIVALEGRRFTYSVSGDKLTLRGIGVTSTGGGVFSSVSNVISGIGNVFSGGGLQTNVFTGGVCTIGGFSVSRAGSDVFLQGARHVPKRWRGADVFVPIGMTAANFDDDAGVPLELEGVAELSLSDYDMALKNIDMCNACCLVIEKDVVINPYIDIRLSGAASMFIRAPIGSCDARLSGASSLACSDIECVVAIVSGASTGTFYNLRKFSVIKASGASRVKFTKSAACVVEKHSSGAAIING